MLVACRGRETEALEDNVFSDFEVVVVGGGVAGLFLAILLTISTQGHTRTRIYDSRWTKRGGILHWKPEEGCKRYWTPRVVTLDSRFWTSLPDDLQELLFPPNSYAMQWPLERSIPGHSIHPRNVNLRDFEVQLLRAVQREPYFRSIDLYPTDYTYDEHCQVRAKRPFHALVLADGSSAMQVRDEVFQPLVGVDQDEASQPSMRAIEVMYDLENENEHPSVIENTALSLSQKRYSLTALDKRRGSIRIRLTEEESEAVGAVDGPEMSVLEGATASGSALRQCVLEGLQLFGIPERAVTSIAGLLAMPGQSRRTELVDCRVPSGADEMAHPHVFLLGEAAGTLSLQPGHELDGVVRAAGSLAQQVTTLQQCLSAKWPVDGGLFSDYDRELRAVQVDEETRCPRHLVLDDPKPDGTRKVEPSGMQLFLTAVKDVHARLATGILAPEQALELPTVDSLCEKVSSSGLDPGAYLLLSRTGTWFVGEQRDVAPAGLLSEAAGGMQSTGIEDMVPATSEVPQKPADTSPRSHYNRGVRFLKGKDCDQSDAKAAEAFRQAGQQGHLEAQYAMGVMFLRGKGVKQDHLQAVRWFTRAAEQDHAKAAYNLGLMRQYGVGVERNLSAASTWMALAAEGGHRKARKSSLLVTFGVGDWMDYDPKVMGVDAILREAQGGDKNAQYKMGAMLCEGDGIEQDKGKASYWFMQAAQQGLAEAQYQMSRMLFLGDGVEQDEEYALRLLWKAAEQGHIEAQHNLGVKLYFGEGVGMDRQGAAQWFLKAANQGFPQSQNNIGWMLAIGDGVQQNMEKGRKWLEDAAANGNIEAQMHINALSGKVVGM